MHVGIFGSCVTRDFFGEDPEVTIRPYAARCSVVSAVSPPLELTEEAISLESSFQRRCVLADFNKTFFETVRDANPEVLLIDLIDERFNLLSTGSTIVTESVEFLESGLADDPRFGFEVLRRDEEPAEELLARSIPVFAERVRAIMPAERVVVHEAYWMTHYKNGADVLPFPDERLTWIEFQNGLLERGYRLLRDSLDPECTWISLDRAQYTADAGHRWGLAPIHYEQAYYDAARERLGLHVDQLAAR